ncbi:Subtilase family protein [Rhizobiales bacterium GAS188]|nr:Subtilase family protein [Rhizobiales bacterium GAS188]
MDGTSMATPHIAGLAALLLGAKPDATVDQLAQAILDSCRRPSGMPQDRANRGVPDAALAFKILTPTAGVALGARRTSKTARKKAVRGAKPAKIRVKGPKTPTKRPAAAGRARRKP